MSTESYLHKKMDNQVRGNTGTRKLEYILFHAGHYGDVVVIDAKWTEHRHQGDTVTDVSMEFRLLLFETGIVGIENGVVHFLDSDRDHIDVASSSDERKEEFIVQLFYVSDPVCLVTKKVREPRG